eukprot:scaffold495_cov243-Pinguiococcus_pyrenoidosus.AAC.36
MLVGFILNHPAAPLHVLCLPLQLASEASHLFLLLRQLHARVGGASLHLLEPRRQLPELRLLLHLGPLQLLLQIHQAPLSLRGPLLRLGLAALRLAQLRDDALELAALLLRLRHGVAHFALQLVRHLALRLVLRASASQAGLELVAGGAMLPLHLLQLRAPHLRLALHARALVLQAALGAAELLREVLDGAVAFRQECLVSRLQLLRQPLCRVAVLVGLQRDRLLLRQLILELLGQRAALALLLRQALLQALP